MAIVHLVAHALPGRRPLAAPAAAWWLFRSLRARWPNALAACLMPDHLHLIVAANPHTARRELAHTLSGFARRPPRSERIWQPTPMGIVIPDRQHLARQVRYVHLNPCREGLASDPLAWEWSTHAGVIGAEVEPWSTAERLAEALGHRRQRFPEWFHAYVSGDPSVHPGGSAFPVAASACEVAWVPLERIARAANRACVWSSRARNRAAICLLARQQGWRQADSIAAACGISSDHVRRLWRTQRPELLHAAALCLGDERLHNPAAPATMLRAG